jgi:transposase InsO family protein
VGKVAPNIIARDFKADRPNQKWTTDVTEFAVNNQKVYLSPILDMYNGEIISYNISLHPTFHQTMDMLDKAFAKIPDNTGLILHSDYAEEKTMPKFKIIA